MDANRERTIGIALIVLLFLVMVFGVAFILIKNPPQDSKPKKIYPPVPFQNTKNEQNFQNERPKPSVPQSGENAVAPETKQNDISGNGSATERIKSQSTINNPSGGSLLRADYIDCGKSEIELKNTSGRTDDMNFMITADMEARINGEPITVECLDQTGDYHIRSGKTCKINLNRVLYKGDNISLFMGFVPKVSIINGSVCN